MTKMEIVMAKSKKITESKEWKEFKTKWDNNIPSLNSIKYKEYNEDAKKIQILMN